MNHLWIGLIQVFWTTLSFLIYSTKVFVEGKGELDYLAMFLPQQSGAPYGGFNILEIAANLDTVVAIEIPYLKKRNTLTIQAGEVKTFYLPGRLRTSLGEFVSNKTIHIRTSRRVTVKGLNFMTSSADSFLAMPIGKDFTRFRAISYTQTNVRPRCVLAVTSLLARNVVHITSTAKASFRYGERYYRNGEVLQVKLRGLEMVQVESYDVTGLLVTSYSPVAVYSGCNCVSVPKFSAECDHIVEQMPPLTTWGRDFVLSYITPRRSGEIYRVLSSCNATQIRVNGQGYGALEEGEYLEFKSKPSEISNIHCSNPCLVAMFFQGHGVDNKRGDPAMTIVPHIRQWTPTIRASWNFKCSSWPRAKQNCNTVIHYIMLITESVHTVGTMLNGKLLGSGKTWTAIPKTNYSATVFQLELGKQFIRHINPQVKFGSISFGLGAGVSYAHPGNLELTANPNKGCKRYRISEPSNIRGGVYSETEVEVDGNMPLVIALACLCAVLLAVVFFFVFVTFRLRRNIHRLAQQEKIIIVPRASLPSSRICRSNPPADVTASARSPETAPPYIEIYDDP